MSAERTFAVQLTPDEASALRLAAVFGRPERSGPNSPALESALAKLRAFERRFTRARAVRSPLAACVDSPQDSPRRTENDESTGN